MTETPAPPSLQQFHSVNLVTEVITHTDMNDRTDWVPISDGVLFKPLFFDVTQGGWSNVLCVQPGFRLARHYHTAPVHGFTIKGSWHYPEHDWTANAGTYIFEPPGEAHTLVVEPGGEEMMTFFVTRGSLVYTDAEGNPTGYEDVFTRLAQARTHYSKIGKDPAELDAIIR